MPLTSAQSTSDHHSPACSLMAGFLDSGGVELFTVSEVDCLTSRTSSPMHLRESCGNIRGANEIGSVTRCRVELEIVAVCR